MQLKESLITIKRNLPLLQFIAQNAPNNQHQIDGAIKLRQALNEFDSINAFKPDIDAIRSKTPLFETESNRVFIDQATFPEFGSLMTKIYSNAVTILQFWEDIVTKREDAIDIKLPVARTFGDLENIVKDLKLSIETTLNAIRIEHKLEIITAEPGSIWLQVALGTSIAVQFIGQICQKATKIMMEFAKVKSFREYARTLKLGNDEMENLIARSEKATDLYLESLAEDLLKENHNEATQEIKNYIQFSIRTIADLMEQGAKFLPESSKPEITNSFPPDRLDNNSSIRIPIDKSGDPTAPST